ncbi:DNA polymerase theta [Culicoides brevitarsis]|uniref:DNA polymerase theta n=1 Tax=Culicoides brevitarsis TaxID=469753 RepID=UPI00307B71BE
MSNWGLPKNVLAEYHKKGVTEMFDWQCECLSNTKVLFDGSNLVYSAPTSAGKTLVSEILMTKIVLEKKKKALMILPFVSVVREKMNYLQELLTPAGLRVEGFFGGYHPPGGFEQINIAICTIEKANSIVNRLLETNKLSEIGVIVVDEVHLIGDSSRGYILELLLAKVMYMCEKFAIKIQIITMSATLPNLQLLQKWLRAELYHTDFRPVELREMIKIGSTLFDAKLQILREIPSNNPIFARDQDNVAQLCLETILEGCSVLIFCPGKDWCEELATNIARIIHEFRKLQTPEAKKLVEQIQVEPIKELKMQLINSPGGLEQSLDTVLTYACAYHHAGLTAEEREIVENGFKMGVLKIIVATSTLSSGVNLPARRVVIRSPMFGGKIMDSLTYKQMIGRAGRKGKDTLGESILICTEAQKKAGESLISTKLQPLTSCLDVHDHIHLKRAILETIASNVVQTRTELESFMKCTLLCTEKGSNFTYFTNSDTKNSSDPIASSISFLLEYEFVRLQHNEDLNEEIFVATKLGTACLSASLPPNEGFMLFSELQKSRQCFVLESELHAIYLVTPYSVCYQLHDVDWLSFVDLWEKLPKAMRRIGEVVGVKNAFLMKAMRSKSNLDQKSLQIHKRFYIALALQELVNEVPLNRVAAKYKCSKGMLQTLQQMASTFAGIVTSFCTALNWDLLALIVGQFKDRLFFGIHRDLVDLMQLPDLNAQRARALFNAGITDLRDLATSDTFTIEKILHNSLSFDTEKQKEGEAQYEAAERKNLRKLFITGKSGLSISEAAKTLIEQARNFLTLEMGVNNVDWSKKEEKMEENVEKSSKKRKSSEILDSEANTPQPKKLLNKSHGMKLRSSMSPRESPQASSTFKTPTSPLNISRTGKRLSNTQNLNKSSEEIECSQGVYSTRSRIGRSRVAQRTQRTQIPQKAQIQTSPVLISSPNESLITSDEFIITLDDSLGDNPSLFHQSLLMNVSESISTGENFGFKELHIVDVCKNRKFFEAFEKEIKEKVSEMSVSVGISSHEAPVKLTIGGNLLQNHHKTLTGEENFKFKVTSETFLEGIAFCFSENYVYYLTMQDKDNDPFITTHGKVKLIKDLLKRSDVTLTFYDAKEHLKALSHAFEGILTVNAKIFDPKVANWLLQPDSDNNLEEMISKYARKTEGVWKMLQKGGSFNSVALNYGREDDARMRSCVESCVVQSVIKEQIEQLQDTGSGYLFKSFTDMEMPIQTLLYKMEFYGMAVDKDRLVTLKDLCLSLQKEMLKEIFKLVGHKFNIESTTEVAKVLKLQKKPGKTRASTSKDTLKKLNCPIADLIMQYRQLSAALTKFLYPFIKNGIESGRIHSKSCYTNTGRLSMYEPSLQNVSKNFVVSLENGAKVHEISCRSAFRVPAGRLILSADFCQLELRILTHLSQDPSLIRIMNSDEDVFRSIAAAWYKTSVADVTVKQRNDAKQICYGIIYGMGLRGFAEALETTEEEAFALIEQFHLTYPGIRNYTEIIVNKARRKGFVETLIGRRRYLPKIKDGNAKEQHQSERQAVNTTIQGSAADIAKHALIRMEKNLQKYEKELGIGPKNDVNLILHVHDELVYEVPADKITKIAKVLRHSMENCIKMSIPLRVKMKMGRSWGEMTEI